MHIKSFSELETETNKLCIPLTFQINNDYLSFESHISTSEKIDATCHLFVSFELPDNLTVGPAERENSGKKKLPGALSPILQNVALRITRYDGKEDLPDRCRFNALTYKIADYLKNLTPEISIKYLVRP
jgi:hypothetical protein